MKTLQVCTNECAQKWVLAASLMSLLVLGHDRTRSHTLVPVAVVTDFMRMLLSSYLADDLQI